jgi:hypothetical protein
VLFNRSPAPWELRAPDADWGSPGQTAKIFGSELPLSKSGALIASPYPQPSITRQQWLDIAHLVTPNLVDYFTKPIPPPAPFPSTPGKIPSDANPYAPGELFEAATLLSLLEGGLFAPLARGAAGIAEEAAPGTIARIAGVAGAAPALGARLLSADAELAALSARAKQVHAALDNKIAQRLRTTAVLSIDGDTIIAGGKRDLTPRQRAALEPGGTGREITRSARRDHDTLQGLQCGADSAGLGDDAANLRCLPGCNSISKWNADQ